MICKKPYMKIKTGHNKWSVVAYEEGRINATPFPCGQCLHCRINKAREWTHRLLLEARNHEYACFITLTYSPENLPEDNCLQKKHLRDFLNRLRYYASPIKIRYFAVGEYGDKTWRPHYHLIVFGLGEDCDDIVFRAWQEKGFIYVGDLNKDSARYVTGYCLKKMNREDDERLNGLAPEFISMSKKNGGLGLQTVLDIGDRLKSTKHVDERLQVIRELFYGKKALPLGRYLTQKLIEYLDNDDDQVFNEIYDYQQKLFDDHLEQDEDYYQHLVDEEEGKRKKQEFFAKTKGKRSKL